MAGVREREKVPDQANAAKVRFFIPKPDNDYHFCLKLLSSESKFTSEKVADEDQNHLQTSAENVTPVCICAHSKQALWLSIPSPQCLCHFTAG